MLIYNVTTGVDKDVVQEWLRWMKETHIPDVMETQMFTSYKLYKVLSSEDENTISYAVQYSAQSLNEVERYLEEFAPALREKVQRKFGDKLASFRTLLEDA